MELGLVRLRIPSFFVPMNRDIDRVLNVFFTPTKVAGVGAA
jgi:hypothetical protein